MIIVPSRYKFKFASLIVACTIVREKKCIPSIYHNIILVRKENKLLFFFTSNNYNYCFN